MAIDAALPGPTPNMSKPIESILRVGNETVKNMVSSKAEEVAKKTVEN